MSINRVILLGNVGKDPDIRHTQAGDTIASLSLATSRRWKDKTTGEDKETTEWHRVVVFNPHVADIVDRFVKKGSKIGVEGALATRKYTDQQGVERSITEIVVGRFDGGVTLESAAPSARQSETDYGTTTNRTPRNPAPATSPNAPLNRAIDDDIPF